MHGSHKKHEWVLISFHKPKNSRIEKLNFYWHKPKRMKKLLATMNYEVNIYLLLFKIYIESDKGISEHEIISFTGD